MVFKATFNNISVISFYWWSTQRQQSTCRKSLTNIMQLSPLLDCDPMVCLPEKSKVTREIARVWPNFLRGDKPSGSHSNKDDNWYIISNIFASDRIKGSNYNWKHVRLTWELPWDSLASGGPCYETLRLAVDPTNG
jgi:hypothetical protein